MARRHVLVCVLCVVLAPAAVAACSRSGAARLDLVMKAPQGVLDDAESVSLSVFPASGVTCDASGHASKIPDGEDTKKFSLERGGSCPAGSWCKDVVLDQDDADKMFAVSARDAAGVVGEGCVVAKVDQDPLEVEIKIHKYNPPPCCNDGKLQAGEQCDPPGQPSGAACSGVTATLSCGDDCTAREIPLDRAEEGSPPPAMTTTQLGLAFCRGDGERDNALRAVFTDTTSGANGGSDVAVRMLRHDFSLFETELGTLNGPLRLPALCSASTGPGLVRLQNSPAIAAVSQAVTAVVFLNDGDQGNPGSLFEVFLSRQTENGCAETPPIQVNKTARIAKSPDVASGHAEAALIVWTNVDNQVLGRIWQANTDKLIPADGDLVLADSGVVARVAGHADGWQVAYQGSGPGDGTGIFLRSVDPSGNMGEPVPVNIDPSGTSQDPDIAMFPDGRAVVTWSGPDCAGSGGCDVYFQRFTADGQRGDPADQLTPIHASTEGKQVRPAVSPALAVGDYYVIAWENAEAGTISARYVGAAEGFLYNSVTGQNDDFIASHPGIAGVRRAPAVAVGGEGIAIGWQDESAQHAGVYIRRFPLPVQ